MESEKFIICPYCEGGIIITSVNCGIFRHAQYISGAEVNPHASKEELEKIKKEIHGCGGAFKFNGEKVEKSDYL
jgi:hypothetical protein